MKNWKLFAGVALLVQSASFIALFIMLYRILVSTVLS